VTKSDRCKARLGKGRLRDRAVTPRTRQLYWQHVQFFFRWLHREQRPLPLSVWQFDEQLCDFAEALWEEGDSRRTLSYTLSGLSFHVQSLTGRLSASWKLHKIWERTEPAVRTPPLTMAMVRAISGEFLRRGHPRAAFCILVGYHCLLRTGELLGLLVGDIRCTACTTQILLRNTKSGQRLNIQELVPVSDVFLRQCAQEVLRSSHHGEIVCGMSSYKFRQVWGDALYRLKIEARFLPYGLRRGGATAFFQRTGSFSLTSDRGRWRNERTTRCYVTSALLELSQSYDTLPVILSSGQCLHGLLKALAVPARKVGHLVEAKPGRALVLRPTQGEGRLPRGGSANMRRCTAALPLL